MKNILIPTDFSRPSFAALETGVELAKRSGGSVTVLHVIEQVATDSYTISGEGHPDSVEERLFNLAMIRKSRTQLEKLVIDPRFREVRVSGELKIGNAFHGIRTIIAEQQPDLVVMGTKGNGSLERMLIGSNTEKVLRTMKCPVFTVHRKPARFDFKNIVYATSMADEEKHFAQVVKKIQQFFGATIHLVRINTPGDFQKDRTVKQYMAKFLKQIGLKNYTLNVYSDVSVEDGISCFADDINADLICMATHGRTGFAHLIGGSIAEEVVNHTRRPILTWVLPK